MLNGKVIYVIIVGYFMISATILSKLAEGYLLSGETHSRDHNSHYAFLTKIMPLHIINIQKVFNDSISAIEFSAE
jgi:hypothetical protein